MAHLPLVSIVIRSTDRQVFLAQALKSVEDQSYRNIEIVLVAACPDHTPAPLQIGAFPLHFIDSQSRVSRSDAANMGLKHCHGTFILILDDDDIIFPQHVEKLVSAILEQKLKHPDLLAVFTDYEVVDGELQNPRPSGSPNFDPLKLLCGNFMTTNCVLFDRQVLDLGCAFDWSLDVFEDWDFWIQLSQYGIFKKVEGVSAYYRIHQSSGVHEIQAFFSHAHQLLYQKWLPGPHHINFLKLIEFSWRSFVQIDQQKDDILSLKSDLARTQQQLDQWLIENKALQTYKTELLKTHQQHDQLLLDHEKLQTQHADLLQSHSWLITSPLRRFAYVFKRLLAISFKLPRLFKTQGIWKKYKSLVDRRALSWLMRLSSLSNKMSICTWFSTLPWIKGYKKADHHSFAPYKVFKALRGSTENKSFALLVTYAPNGLISDTTVYYLQQLLKKSIHVVLCVHVDNEELEFKENESLNVADAILVRKNIGFDFALWASALTVMPQLWQARQLIFTNDSILGPLASFDPLVQSLNNHEADFIALTDSHQLRYHAQSFFFSLQHQALNNSVVRAFWSQVLSFQTKQDVINAYELNLWEIFSAHGQLKFDILFKTQDLIPSGKDPKFLNFNPTHQKWKELITEGFPFVKSELLQKNPTHMHIADWDQFIKPFCYDDQLVRLIQSHLDYLKATKLR